MTPNTAHSNSPGTDDAPWDLVIEPRRSLWSLRLGEVWQSRDLLLLFVRRDFVTFYKQTVLGPLWFFLQPLLRVAIYYIIFARVANIPTDGVPPILFYLGGLTFWEYFASCWKKTSETFSENQHIFGKVYFPRLVVPLSVMLSNGIKLLIQFLLFALCWAWYRYQGAPLSIQAEVVFLPVVLLILAMMGLGAGLVVTSLTTRYRDLKFLLDTLIQLLMYVSPVLYPISLAEGAFRKLLLLNPLSAVLESIKYMFMGVGLFSWSLLAYSAAFGWVLLVGGILVFNRTERNFIDTV
jgi:lipopolysaccharide transport system permease protein